MRATAGETFEMTVSSELSKARSRFGDIPAFETSAGASLAVPDGCRLCKRGRGCQETDNDAVFPSTNDLLDPGFGAQRQIYCHGICAIHQPDSGNQLKQPYQAATQTPRQ